MAKQKPSNCAPRHDESLNSPMAPALSIGAVKSGAFAPTGSALTADCADTTSTSERCRSCPSAIRVKTVSRPQREPMQLFRYLGSFGVNDILVFQKLVSHEVDGIIGTDGTEMVKGECKRLPQIDPRSSGNVLHELVYRRRYFWSGLLGLAGSWRGHKTLCSLLHFRGLGCRHRRSTVSEAQRSRNRRALHTCGPGLSTSPVGSTQPRGARQASSADGRADGMSEQLLMGCLCFNSNCVNRQPQLLAQKKCCRAKKGQQWHRLPRATGRGLITASRKIASRAGGRGLS